MPFHTYLPDKPNSTLNFKLTNVIENNWTYPVINKLMPKSSSGVDDLSNKVIKHMQKITAEPLTINQMLNTGIEYFLIYRKSQKFSPLFKKKDNDKFFPNYRPISLLPSILKIFENVILKANVGIF